MMESLSIGPAVVKNIVGMYLDGINGFRIMIQLVVDNIQKTTKPIDNDSIMEAVTNYKDWFKDYQDTLFHTNEALEIKVPEDASSANAETSDNNSGMSRIMGIILAGQMLFFTFYTGAYSMMTILREQEQGTLARLFTTPTNRITILAGKFLAVFWMVSVQSIVMLLVGAYAFNVQWGQPVNIVLLTTGQVIAAGGLGVMLISFVKTSKQAGPVLGAGLTLLGMLGGLFTANAQMPEAFSNLAFFTPQGWAINGWKLSMSGAPLSDIILNFFILLAMGLLMFSLGAVNFRRRFA
jgi:ABC-2 type transport system permease protein